MPLPSQVCVDPTQVEEVPVVVPLADGSEFRHTFLIRPLTFAELPMLGIIERMDNTTLAAKAKATIVSMALVEPDGVTPVCTAEEAGTIDPLVGAEIFTAIMRKAARGKKKAT